MYCAGSFIDSVYVREQSGLPRRFPVDFGFPTWDKLNQARSQAALRLRPATFEDAAAVCHVQERNGGSGSESVWRDTWESYPLEKEFQDVPIGWVLETDDGSIVGCLDNVHMLYEFEGMPIRAAIASGWAVDMGYRGKALQLMIAFFRQKGIDLLLNVSANPTTAQVLTAMRIARIPVPDYGIPCFWAARPRAFAKAILLRRGTPGAAVWAWPAGLLLLLRDMVRQSGRGRPSLPIRRSREFDDRFDTLWQGLRTGTARLRAVRTRAVLEWRFRNELRDGRIAIVTAEPGGVLVGYALLVRRPGSELGMTLYDIADLQSLHEDPEVTRESFARSDKNRSRRRRGRSQIHVRHACKARSRRRFEALHLSFSHLAAVLQGGFSRPRRSAVRRRLVGFFRFRYLLIERELKTSRRRV